MAVSTIFLTINSGNQHSEGFANVRNAASGMLTLVSPAMTSCQLFLQCGTQANSASMKRVDFMGSGGPSSSWVWSIGVGDRAIPIPWVGPLLRVETSVVQDDNRSLSLIVGGL